jgi:hypothetical protein
MQQMQAAGHHTYLMLRMLTGIHKTSTSTRYRYPQKSIGKDDDYLEIGVIEYVPPGFETGKIISN